MIETRELEACQPLISTTGFRSLAFWRLRGQGRGANIPAQSLMCVGRIEFICRKTWFWVHQQQTKYSRFIKMFIYENYKPKKHKTFFSETIFSVSNCIYSKNNNSNINATSTVRASAQMLQQRLQELQNLGCFLEPKFRSHGWSRNYGPTMVGKIYGVCIRCINLFSISRLCFQFYGKHMQRWSFAFLGSYIWVWVKQPVPLDDINIAGKNMCLHCPKKGKKVLIHSHAPYQEVSMSMAFLFQLISIDYWNRWHLGILLIIGTIIVIYYIVPLFHPFSMS